MSTRSNHALALRPLAPLSLIVLAAGCALALSACGETASAPASTAKSAPITKDRAQAKATKAPKSVEGFELPDPDFTGKPSRARSSDPWQSTAEALKAAMVDQDQPVPELAKADTSSTPTSPRRPRSPGLSPVTGLPELPQLSLGQPEAAQDSTPAPAASTDVASSSGPTPHTSADQRPAEITRAQATAHLADSLRPDITAARQPMKAAAPLIALDTIEPGAAAMGLDAIKATVTPDQRRAITAAHEMVSALGNDPNLASANPEALAKTLRQQSDRLAPMSASSTDLTLGTVALCQRVDGFGRYTPVSGTTFLAGRPAAFIVYTEVENFTHQPATGSATQAPDSGWQVELAQSVELHLDSDGTKQFTLPEAIIRDVAKTKRRDFFLVQRVDLPRNLSVGQYNLKIAVRDLPTERVVEHVIPIRVVADPALLTPQSGAASPTPRPKLSAPPQGAPAPARPQSGARPAP